MRGAAAGSASRKKRAAVQKVVDLRKRASFSDALTDANHSVVAVNFLQGRFAGVTQQDVEDVFRILSRDGCGVVPRDVFEEFMRCTVGVNSVEFDALQITFQPGDYLTSKDFYYALRQGRNLSLLRHAHRDKEHRAMVADSLTRDMREAHVERRFMLDRLQWRVHRDDAFGTLPATCIYLIVFMLLVVYHLEIWKRQEVERGMEWFVMSYGKTLLGPYFDDHVYSLETFRGWFIRSGVELLFNDVVNSSGNLGLQLSAGTGLVGDVQLVQTRGDDYIRRSEWLLSSSLGAKYLSTHPHSYLHAANLSASHFLNRTNKWVDDETRDLRLRIYAFNNRAEMYVRTQVKIRLDNLGRAKLVVKANSIPTKPYGMLGIIAVDVLYIMLILYTVWCESKDLLDAICFGWSSFLEYWNFWNFVDWMTIALGAVNIALWLASCSAMQVDSLHKYLSEDGDLEKDGEKLLRLKPNMIGLPPVEMETLHSDLKRVLNRLLALHFSAATTAVFIVIKFFKSFEANPRLQSVTKTIMLVGGDVAHFAVVLIPVYSAFAVMGHVLFGNDLPQFYTLGNSFNTGVILVFGEFEWYDDLTEEPGTFTSEVPRWVLTVWFVAYLWVVMLVMLNMVLAIVLEQHSSVADTLSTRRDARTIWSQSWRWLQRKKDSRGFMPLSKVLLALQNTDHPVHEELAVTTDSLLAAFPGMKPHQATWIMNFLSEELVGSLQDSPVEDDDARSLRMERFVQSIAEELHVVGVNVTDCMSRLAELEEVLAARRMRVATTPKNDTALAASCWTPRNDVDDFPDDSPMDSARVVGTIQKMTFQAARPFPSTLPQTPIDRPTTPPLKCEGVNSNTGTSM